MSATLLRVTVCQDMTRQRTVRVTWKGRTGRYEFPDFLRKDTLGELTGMSEAEAAVRAAIHVLEETLDALVDGLPVRD